MKILVTGGLGFIGVNTAAHLNGLGHDVSVIDNYHRDGVDANEEWLRLIAPEVKIRTLDIRQAYILKKYIIRNHFDLIIHEAAQTAVTTSVEDPAYDFATNAHGTFNIMEAARESGCAVLYASTNKVYGAMSSIETWEDETRWKYSDWTLHMNGIDETAPIDPVSPYGCSKLAGEHYVRDYARIYGLKTVVFRQSCIYGPRQLGGTDQGWLTWFTRAWITGRPIIIFGDGKQVRDVLYIDDLIQAYILAVANIDKVSGEVFNIGGGPHNSTSIWWELKSTMEKVTVSKAPEVIFSDWRPGDQKIHITDNRKLKEVLGWEPVVDVQAGIQKLCSWISNATVNEKTRASA